jgi:succinate dehydrogenase flavin-adding protein (antitoxin of CptAB toxin-antitoxin module)
MKQELKNRLSFFKEIIKPLSLQQQEEILKTILEHKDNEINAFTDMLNDPKNRLLLFVDKDVDCFIDQCSQIHISHEINDLFDVDNVAINEALDRYVDWLDKRGYDLVNWFEGHYTFAYLLCKKTETSTLIETAKKANEELLALLPSRCMPEWFERLYLPLDLEDFDMKEALKEKLKIAKSMNRNLFLYCAMRECKPCNIIEQNINHPLMQEACKDTYLFKIDILRGSNKLRSLYLNITSAPIFVHITDEAMPSDHQIDGDAWGEVDSVETISQALLPFFKDTNHPTRQPSQEEIEECISFLPLTGEYKTMKKLIEDIDIKAWQCENRFLHAIARSYKYHDRYASLVNSMIKKLLDEGEDIDSYNEYGTTPLILSIVHHNWQIALMLLNHAADPLKPSKNEGESPLMKLLFGLYYHRETDEEECMEQAKELLIMIENAKDSDAFIDSLEFEPEDMKTLIKKLYRASLLER